MDSIPVDRDPVVQGELGLGTLPALIRRLHEEKRTGTLHIHARGVERRVHFCWGAVIFAGSDRSEDRLDQRLGNEGLIELETLEAARKAQESSGRRYGESLVELGALTEEELLAAVERQVRSIVTTLFSLDRGQYRFEETEDPVEQDLVLDLPMREIILDGIRSMEDPIALRIGVGAMTDDLHVGRSAVENTNVNSAEAYVLSRVDGRTTVLDILAVSPLSEVETLRSICALLAVGIVEAKNDPAAVPESPPGTVVAVGRPGPAGEEAPIPERSLSTRELSSQERRALAERRFQEGRRLFAERKFHEAIGVLMEAVRLDGEQARYHRLLGHAYARNPKWRDSAVAHLESAIRLDAFDVKSHFLLGDIYERWGRSENARAAFEKVLELDPTHSRARARLERFQNGSGVVSKLKALTSLKAIFRKTSP